MSNPHEGIEQWFEPGTEIMIVQDGIEALAAYRELLADSAQAAAMGARARERVLDEHTYAHRARRVLDLLGLASEGKGCRAAASSRSVPPSTRRAR